MDGPRSYDGTGTGTISGLILHYQYEKLDLVPGMCTFVHKIQLTTGVPLFV